MPTVSNMQNNPKFARNFLMGLCVPCLLFSVANLADDNPRRGIISLLVGIVCFCLALFSNPVKIWLSTYAWGRAWVIWQLTRPFRRLLAFKVIHVRSRLAHNSQIALN